MDVAPVLSIFRIFAPEFAKVGNDVVSAWIELTEPLICRRRFGKLYNQALALLTAHRMKMSNVGAAEADPISDIGDIGIGNFIRVGKFSEGQVSIGFNHNIAQYTMSDAELALTEYGIQFLTLRRMRIIPVVSAAEPLGR